MQAGARNSLDQGGCESLGWEMGAGVGVGAALWDPWAGGQGGDQNIIEVIQYIYRV